MKAFNVFIFLLISAGFFLVSAGTTDVVLQNGLNEYEGCTDSRIYNRSQQNNGGAVTLDIQRKHQTS